MLYRLEIMESMALHLESAYERLYRWTQSMFITFCCFFVDLEKAFDRVPREVISWAMRKLGVKEWLVSQ